MRYIRYAVLAVIAIGLVLIALANRDPVTLHLLPDGVAELSPANPAYRLPLFLVLFGGVAVGLVLGFVWEWIREAGERAQAARQAREMARMRAELRRLKGAGAKGQDDVLALLDEVS